MRKIFLSILCIITVLLTNCKKEDQKEELEYDTQSAQDNALAEATFNDVNNIANQAIENGSGGLSTYRLAESAASLMSPCATVTVMPDSSGTGGNITVDFTNTNCQCVDLRYRRGKIHISYTGAYRDSGTQIVITFENYYVGTSTNNMFNVDGNKTITNLGHNSSGNMHFNIVINGQLTNSNGGIMNWTSTRLREWVSGESTYGSLLAWADDEYLISGNASGNNFEGNSFTVDITTSLRFALNCRWIKEGVFTLTPSGKPPRTLNYGPNNCDDDAVITVNGQSFAIKLR
jgi:hypothetical protein